MDLLAREHAVVWLEVEAKLAELPNFQYSIPLPKGINPHHLSAGRQLLQARGLIQQSSARSRGGASVPYLEPTDRRGRARAIDTAAARKRLLTARFYGWGIARNKRPNLLGTAGERVVHASLLEASPTARSKLLSNTPGDLRDVLGEPVPLGPLDSGAHLLIEDAQHKPSGAVTVLIEVKNIRQWIYPDSDELIVLLDKVASIQTAHPDADLLPVLACRRSHYTTYRMAVDLGFFVIDARSQFLLPSSDLNEAHVDEVRVELGFRDLAITQSASPGIVRRLTKSLPDRAEDLSNRFKETASILGPTINKVRTGEERFAVLRDEATQLPGHAGGW